MTVDHPWQEILDPRLTERLLRPLVRPGRIDPQMSPSIIARYQRLNNRLPLLTQLNRPQTHEVGFQNEALPIVYAQPLPLQDRAMNFTADSSPAPTSQTSQPTVIQAKFERPTSLPNPETAGGSSSNLPEEHRSPMYVQPPEVPPVQPLPSPNQLSQTDTASLFPVQPPSLTDLANPADPEDRPLVRPTSSNSGMSSPSVSKIQVPTVLPLKQSLPPQETQAPLPMPVQLPIVTAQMLTRTQMDPSSPQVPSAMQVPFPIAMAQVSPDMQVVPAMQVVNRLNAANPPGTAPRSVSPISRSQVDVASKIVAASALPIVQVSNGSGSQAQLRTKADTPLVFSIPFSGPSSASSVRPTGNGHTATHPAVSEMVTSVPRVSAQPILNPQTNVSSAPPYQQQKIDVNDLANKVERKLMRRLVVERERRGRTQ
jgi:hypothetical protein